MYPRESIYEVVFHPFLSYNDSVPEKTEVYSISTLKRYTFLTWEDQVKPDQPKRENYIEKSGEFRSKKTKHFNATLRAYVEQLHGETFKNFTDFYDKLKKHHPKARKPVNTAFFKVRMVELQQDQSIANQPVELIAPMTIEIQPNTGTMTVKASDTGRPLSIEIQQSTTSENHETGESHETGENHETSESHETGENHETSESHETGENHETSDTEQPPMIIETRTESVETTEVVSTSEEIIQQNPLNMSIDEMEKTIAAIIKDIEKGEMLEDVVKIDTDMVEFF